jgi:NADH:ubiquinone oxidoreductase subunit 3 (subunit A)
MFDMSPGFVAIFIPILAVIGTFAMIIVVIIMGTREKELKHKERIMAMEKGIEIPKEAAREKRPAYLSLRAWGFVLLFIGIILFFALGVQVGWKYCLWGAMPAAIGAGLLISAVKEQKDIRK